MESQQAIRNLMKYVREDALFNNLEKIESDFDQYCYNHCEDIQTVLDLVGEQKEAIVDLKKEIRALKRRNH